MSRYEKPQGANFTEVREGVSRGEIESELRLVLSDPEFRKNSNSAKFLKFVVDETLDGRGARLKAYTIATLALEREASFDPQANSIVRVQAMRLRELLEGYYSGAGATDPVQILLPRGTYQPAFERRAEPKNPGTVIAAAEPPAWDKSLRRFSNRTVALISSFAVVATVLLAGGAWMDFGHRSGSVWPAAVAGPLDGPCTIVVQASDTVGASLRSGRLSARLFGTIEEGLSNFEYVTLRSSGFQTRANTASGYVLDVLLADSGNGRSDVAFRLVRKPTGEVIWSRHYDDVDPDDRNAVDRLASSVVSDVADPYGGAIFADIRDQLQSAKAPLRGYACLIGAVEFLKSRMGELRTAERKCLESELDVHPANVGALTLLSTILVLSYFEGAPESLGEADLRRASQLARRAYDLAPQRASPRDSLFLVRFGEKHFDDALRLARQVLAANPNSILFAERIASAYIARGMYAEGLALLRPIEATSPGPPIGSLPFLALAAHMRGDANATFEYARRTGAAATPLGLVMRIVACHERGDESCVYATSAQLRADFPGVARDIPAAFDRYAMIDPIKDALLSDLAAAGYASAEPDR